MSIFKLWLLTAVVGLSGFFIAVSIVSAICLIVASLYHAETQGGLLPNFAKYVVGMLCCFLLASIIPSRDDVYFIAGGYAATNIDGVKDLPENLVKAANDFLANSKENPK